ncbi:hypothetical protein [Paenibacillus xylanexedens]|uniref:hypothetical protein n=1 Tax=Paenibacillus xylanexedens TaxID=528191 RepID=UPI001C92F835|nr:hypothetical protein [Paenibacillus xylanexedens]
MNKRLIPTPIGDQWRELYFVYLDKDLNPAEAWKIKPTYRAAFLTYLSGVTSRKITIQEPGKKQSGTRELLVNKVRYATDITTELLKLM